ncbi:MAG: patatin-like phospholipase family protein [Clostridia bacterium]|nr:patatin-like phospholipase family protein [Clostridia bacterium]
MSLGLALSGGGTKGAAHIGVIKALLEEHIDIGYISGTSSGSIIASLFALGYSTEEMKELFQQTCSKIIDFDLMIPFKIIKSIITGNLQVKGIAKGKKLESILSACCYEKKIVDISQIKMPIAIPTVDIRTAEVIYFTNRKISCPRSMLYDDTPTCNNTGKLAQIVRASCSLPGVYEPKIIGDNVLVDGGIRMNTPVSILKRIGASKVLAVSFDRNKKKETSYDNLVCISMQSFDIMGHQVNQTEVEEADLVIRPKLKDMNVLNCGEIESSITSGYRATKEAIGSIRELVGI